MRRFSTGLLLIVFCISVMPTTFAESVNAIDNFIDNIEIQESSSQDDDIPVFEDDGIEYEIKNPYLDKYVDENGEVMAKIYSSARNLIYDEITKEYSELPEGYSYFADYNAGKRTMPNGYQYFIGNGKDIRLDEFSISSYSMSFGEINQSPLLTEQEITEEGVQYREVFPGVDVEFKDGTFSREKFITIKEDPQYLSVKDDLIFSDIMEAPKGATLMIGDPIDGDEVTESGEYDIESQPFYFVLEDGTILRHGNAIAYDNKVKKSEQIDAEAVSVSQRLIFDSEYPDEVLVQQIIPGKYLRDENTQYPVTVDPALHYCKDSVVYLDRQNISSNCDVEDFYARSPGNHLDNNDLFMGRNLGVYRVPVIKFDNIDNFIPQGAKINGAWLNTQYRNNGNGSFNINTGIDYRARMIDTGWGNRSVDYLLANTSRVSSATAISYNPGQEYTWYIEDFVQDWVDTPSSNNGMLLSQDGDKTTWEDRLHILYASNRNNSTVPFLSVSYTEPLAPDPDIEIVYIEQVTPQLKFNQPFQVRVWVKKNGTTNSDYKVRMNLGSDPNDSGPPSQTRTISANAGSTTILLFTVTPSALFAPLDYIRVEVDADDDITESNENNNIESQKITRPASDPDLVLSSMTVDDNQVYPGENTRVRVIVENIGQATSGASNVDYFISPSNSLNGAIFLNSDGFGSLDFEETSSERDTIAIPSYLTAGIHYIIAQVDPDDVVSEDNENNNLRSVAIEVLPPTPQIRIDSLVSISDIPNPIKEGDLLDVRIYRAQNNSPTTDAPNVSYNLILVDSNGDEFALFNQQPSSFNMSSNSTQTLSATGIVPRLNNGGQYKLRVILDHLNDFNELNEVDNTKEFGPFPAEASAPLRSPSGTHYGSYNAPSNWDGASDTNGSLTTDATSIIGDPVNARTGHFDLTHADLLVEGVGQPILFKRTYNSKWNETDARFGAGWSFSYNVYYYQDPVTKNIRLYHGGNLANTFTTTDGGLTFEAPEGSQDTLMNDNGTIVYKTLNGMKFKFAEMIDAEMGLLTEIEDTNGNKTTLSYVPKRNIQVLDTITDPTGRQVSITYGPEADDQLWDNIVKVESDLGNNQMIENTYVYDTSSDPDRVFLESASQKRTYQGVEDIITRRFTYDSEGRMESYSDPRGTKVRNVYDSENRVIEQYMFNPRIHSGTQDDLVYTYNYDHMESGNDIQKCTDYREIQNDSEYSGSIMCFNSEELKVLQKDHLGNTTRFEYSPDGLPSKVIDPKGNETIFTYDNQRRLVSKTLPDTDFQTKTTYTYENNFNKLIESTETSTNLSTGQSISRTMTFDYDSKGNMIESVDYLGEKTTFTHDSKGNILTATDPRGNAYTYTYDNNGNYLIAESIVVTDVDGQSSTQTNFYTYDSFGNKTSRTDGEGNRWEYEYDNLGNIRQQTNPDNSVSTYRYDLENNLIQKVDENGNITDFEIDTNLEESALGSIRRSTSGDLVYQQNYTQLGRKTSSIDPNGNLMSYVYDAANRKIQDTNPVATIQHKYDANSLLIESTNSLGQKNTFEYDQRNQQVSSKAHNGSEIIESTNQYDGFGRLIAQTDANGNTSSFQFDANDRLTKTIDALGNETSYSYDENGNQTQVTDPNGNTTSFGYDELNRIIKSINAEGKVSTTKYDKRGLVIETIDRQNPNGTDNTRRTRFEYDDRGRLTKTIKADGSQVSQKYDAKGNTIESTDELGRKTEMEYDDLDRLVKVIDNDNQETSTKYDSNGNQIEVTNANGNKTQFEYDELNRLTKTTMADGSAKTTTYDSSSNIIQTTDFNGNPTNLEYDLLNRPIKEISPADDISTFTYDKNGNLLSELRGTIITNFEYDALNRLTKQNNPSYSRTYMDRYESYQYDPAGNMVEYKNQRGYKIQYAYDSLNRPITKTKSEGLMNYEYDNWGNLTFIKDESGQTAYTYDLLNRNTTESRQFNGLSDTYTVVRDYFPDGKLESMQDPFTNQIDYSYNNRGQLDKVSLNNDELARYTYDGFGNISEMTTGNGVTTQYSYDVRERTTGINSTLFNAPSSIFEHEYEYDADSNRSKLTENGSITTYQYDNQNQLLEVDNEGKRITYGYRDFGSLSSTTFYEGRTRLGYRRYNRWQSNQHAVTYDYYGAGNTEKKLLYINRFDADGNMSLDYLKNYTPHPNDLNYNFTKRYVWDSENRLIEHYVHTHRDTSDSKFIGKYQYDDAGNRTRKETQDEITYYFNNGLNVLTEITETGQLSKLMIAGANGPIAEATVNGLRYMHTDVQGTTRLVTDDQGQVVAEYEYEPFGELAGVKEDLQGGVVEPLFFEDISVSDAEIHVGYKTEETDYLYTNQEFDDESGLMYYNARYYNPITGRFLSRDSYLGEIGDTLSRSRYAYVKNNPSKYNDPSGNEPVTITVGAVVGVAETILDAGTLAYDKNQLDKAEAELEAFNNKYSEKNFCPAPAFYERKAQLESNVQMERMDVAIGVGALALPIGCNAIVAKYTAKKAITTAAKYGDEVAEVGSGIIDGQKLIGPAGDPGAIVTNQVPNDWVIRTSDNGNGTLFKDPLNPKGNNVRVQIPNLNSQFPSQQVPYVKHFQNGTQRDVFGNIISPTSLFPKPGFSPNAHIPRDQFIFRN